MASKKFTFKNDPAPTGLASVGAKKHINIALTKPEGKRWCGGIHEEGYMKWRVGFMVMKPEPDDNPNCDWKWYFIKERFPSEEVAKAYVKSIDPYAKLYGKYDLRFCEPN